MERHGPAGHVYSLPSSRHRIVSRTANDDGVQSTERHAAPLSSPSTQGQPSQQPRYSSQSWHLLALRRCSPAASSAPNSPSAEAVPYVAPGKGTASLLVVTLLHLPTDVIYAWPIALSGTSNGRCMVTQPARSPAEAGLYAASAVLSESIKVLSDVIGAWIKTAPMREALRRKESRRQNGTRRLGQSEQDAAWINDSLGLADMDAEAQARALERSWKEEGDSITPPPRSPAASAVPLNTDSSSVGATSSPRQVAPRAQWHSPMASNTASSPPPQLQIDTFTGTPESSSRPTTPRIEISVAPDYIGPGPLAGATPRGSIGQAIENAGKQQAAVEQEIAQWMSTATLSDFTRRRPTAAEGVPPQAPNSGSTPSSPVTRPASPSILRNSSSSSTRARVVPAKRVSFNSDIETSPSLTALASPSSSPALFAGYRPVFAPAFSLQPSLEEDLSTYPPASLPASVPASRVEDLGSMPPSPTRSPRISPSSSPPHGTSPRQSPQLQTPVPLPLTAPSLSPTSPKISHTRSRTSSKLSQEVPREELTGVVEPSRRSFNQGRPSGKSLSPVASLGDLKSAFKAWKPTKGLKQKIPSA
ncbi:unnamed protein product [Parajaminaea phylloscopi]